MTIDIDSAWRQLVAAAAPAEVSQPVGRYLAEPLLKVHGIVVTVSPKII
jgi:hypothetical protein